MIPIMLLLIKYYNEITVASIIIFIIGYLLCYFLIESGSYE
jgi:hypothetical protein